MLRTLVLRQRRKTRLMRNLTPLRGYKTIFNRFNKFQYELYYFELATGLRRGDLLGLKEAANTMGNVSAVNV